MPFNDRPRAYFILHMESLIGRGCCLCALGRVVEGGLVFGRLGDTAVFLNHRNSVSNDVVKTWYPGGLRRTGLAMKPRLANPPRNSRPNPRRPAKRRSMPLFVVIFSWRCSRLFFREGVLDRFSWRCEVCYRLFNPATCGRSEGLWQRLEGVKCKRIKFKPTVAEVTLQSKVRVFLGKIQLLRAIEWQRSFCLIGLADQ